VGVFLVKNILEGASERRNENNKDKVEENDYNSNKTNKSNEISDYNNGINKVLLK